MKKNIESKEFTIKHSNIPYNIAQEFIKDIKKDKKIIKADIIVEKDGSYSVEITQKAGL